MTPISRRSFLKTASLATAGAAFSSCVSAQRVIDANEDVRIGIVGLGITGGRGNSLVTEFGKLPGVRLVALCDVDSAILGAAMAKQRDLGHDVKSYADYRDVLARPDVDAVIIATPNHQHALQAIWACQAGKDVYLEKPVCHNIWEGRKIIEAAAKYQRIIQVGSQARSSDSVAEAVAWVRAGNIGHITDVHGLCYKRRDTIGLTTGPQPVPATVNYDLWLGPAPLAQPRRTKFHYDWHWFWDYGNGDLGNQGVHQLDIARWFLGESALAPRVLTVGGRLGYIDDAQTPNTLVTWHDYAKAPLIFEVRGLPTRAGTNQMDNYQGASVGVVVHCEGGSVVVPATYISAQALDRDGQVLKNFASAPPSHAANFIEAVRSRKLEVLHAPIREGYRSSSLAHISNISYRLGQKTAPDIVLEQIKGDSAHNEAYGRMAEHLGANGVDLAKTPLTLGAPLALDTVNDRFINNDDANALLTAEYRKPFVVPDRV
jgi:predicted dehydrogenase